MCPKCNSESVTITGSSSSHDYYKCNKCGNTWTEKK